MNDLQKHTLNLRKGDWDYLESICRPNGIATSLAVRSLISQYVDAKRAEEMKNGGQVPDVEIEI